MTEKNKTVGGTLYLVATPIGNRADISERALKVLSEVDFIAAEDTRNSGLLLSHYGISKPFVSYHEHNKYERGEHIANRLESGESCALITDAGTPAISDPGEDIVALCAARGIPVSSIPGACAAVTALSMSALPTRRFVFEGFLPPDKGERRRRLALLANETRTVILYEAPHKLKRTLGDMLSAWGDRRISICRELTKLNEEVIRTTIAEAVRLYEENDPRGEYVLVIDGAAEAATADEYPEDPEAHVQSLMDEGLSRMDAIKAAAKARGLSKGAFYKQLLAESEAE
ncbi:MAG: 16S rRNA (cytidine(1402)-2'-O)-methyltransferase [Clostridia bacterium]|nr:16S rRNA (cytidine(1402)-2'-O)-methyltransferase [Clostridia bacterium]